MGSLTDAPRRLPESMLTRRPFLTAAPLLAVALAGCHHNGGNAAPPRIDTAANLPSESSTIIVPVDAPLVDIERALDQQTPRQLWKIDQHQDKCVAAKKVNLGIAHVKIVHDLV